MSEPLHVGCGSIASIPRCPRYVRLCSKSGDKAAAKPPSAGPHQPPLQRASVTVAIAAAAMAVAAVRAVRDFLMTDVS